MTFRPETLALTVLLGVLTALGPLATDMYLPSLPALTEGFGATPAQGQLTLSAFLVGFASTQIFYGPLSDRYGRKVMLLAGLVVFAIGSLLCAFAPSLPVLIAARVLQAIGASGPIVLARAVARDLYSGRRAGQELARMATIMGLVPMLAPLAGALIALWFGWRGTFVASAGLGVVLIVMVALRLPETRPDSDAPSTPLGMLRVFAHLIRDRVFLVYTALVCMSYSGIFTFISVSSFILQGVYGLTPMLFGAAFGFCSFAYILGTIAGRRVAGRLGIDAGIALGIILMAAGGFLMILAVQADFGGVYAIIAASAIFFAGNGSSLPQAMAGTLMPFPDAAGAASSLMGVCQMVSAALVGIAVAALLDFNLFDHRAMPLAVGFSALGFSAIAIYWVGRPVRKAARAGEI